MKSGFIASGGWWVLAQSVLMALVFGLAVALPGDWTSLGLIVPGLILFLAGGVIGIAGVIALEKNRTPFPKPRECSRLIQTGIYSRVRHPLYTSVICASFGWALIWQSLPAFLAGFVLILFFLAKAAREEQWLREKFPDYAEYEKRVPGFLPGWKRRR